MIKRIKHSLEYLIDKSSQNATTEAEENFLEKFTISEYHKSDWDEVNLGKSKTASEKLFKQIQFRIAKKKLFSSYFKYAAAASIVFIIGLGFYMNTATDVEKQITFKTASSSKSIQLSDGSVIYLSANSILNYPVQFKGRERKVSLLKGNAFFDIAKDKKHPFIISSGAIKTKVLGTSFHIQLSKSKCTVMVLTGKVNVSTKNQSIDLVPNEEALLSDEKLTKENVDKLFLVNWYNEDITLNQVTVNQVIKLLQYKYGLAFEYNNDVKLSSPLTLSIGKDASIESVLKQINYITNLKFEVYGEVVKVN